MNARQNLVIVRAGDNSLHPRWLEGDNARNWDIVVNYFGDDPNAYRRPDVRRIDSKGPKWPALHDLLQANPEFMRYRYVWFPDDDLMASQADINRIFETCDRYRLEVAQPALSWDSYISHLITLRNPSCILRYTNYVEIMAPCISSTVLRRALPMFNATLSGWGLDHAWQQLVDDCRYGIAVIDSVTVRHTRPIGGPNYQKLREAGVSGVEEMFSFWNRFGISAPPVMETHAAILPNGKLTIVPRNTLFTLRLMFGYLPAVLYAPCGRGHLTRSIFGLTRRMLLGQPVRLWEP